MGRALWRGFTGLATRISTWPVITIYEPTSEERHEALKRLLEVGRAAYLIEPHDRGRREELLAAGLMPRGADDTERQVAWMVAKILGTMAERMAADEALRLIREEDAARRAALVDLPEPVPGEASAPIRRRRQTRR
jgi:hypothetical protein